MFEPHKCRPKSRLRPVATVARLFSLGLLVLIVTLAAAPSMASGQALDEAVANLDLNGYWIEPGAEGDLGEYSDLALEAADTGQAWFFVTLASPAEDGNSVFADDAYGLTTREGTVIVASPTDGGYDVAVVSSPHLYTSAQIDAALDQAAVVLAGTEGEAIERHRAVFDALSAQEPTTSAESNSTLVVVLGVGTVALLGGLWWRRRSLATRGAAQDQAEIETARAEIRDQLDAVANAVVDIADRIDLSDDAQAETYYREATATFTQVERQLADATSLLELADLNDDIELARWKMDAAEARLDGRPVPTQPQPDAPVECFFDPTHRLGTEDAVVTTPAGSKTVKVCERCADKLRQGEQPRPRMIKVKGERVPAARAPRSHGGLGMGGIDIFDIILGTAAMTRGQWRSPNQPARNRPPLQRPTYDWGPPRPRSPRNGGVFGPDRVPRTNPNRPARPSSRRRSSKRPTNRRRPSAGGSGRRIL